MRVVVVTPPDPVVTIEEAKRHLKQDSDDDALLIEAYVAAATAHIDGPDGWLGRSIGVQTLDAFLPAFGVVSIALPYPPAIDIIEVSYVGTDGEAHEVDASTYEIAGSLLRAAWANAWPEPAWRGASGETVRIRYRAGYPPRVVEGQEPVSTVPAPIKAAILLMTGDLYRNRDTTSASATAAVSVPMSTTVQNLLSPFRVFR